MYHPAFFSGTFFYFLLAQASPKTKKRQLFQRTGVTSLAASGDWLLTASFSAPLKLWHLPSAGADLANLKKAGRWWTNERWKSGVVHGDWVEVAENDQKTTAASLNYIHFNYETHLFDRDSNKIGTWQFCEDLTFYGDGSLGHDLASTFMPAARRLSDWKLQETMRQLWICALFVVRSMPFVQMVQHRSALEKSWNWCWNWCETMGSNSKNVNKNLDMPWKKAPRLIALHFSSARWNFFKVKRVPWEHFGAIKNPPFCTFSLADIYYLPDHFFDPTFLPKLSWSFTQKWSPEVPNFATQRLPQNWQTECGVVFRDLEVWRKRHPQPRNVSSHVTNALSMRRFVKEDGGRNTWTDGEEWVEMERNNKTTLFMGNSVHSNR